MIQLNYITNVTKYYNDKSVLENMWHASFSHHVSVQIMITVQLQSID